MNSAQSVCRLDLTHGPNLVPRVIKVGPLAELGWWDQPHHQPGSAGGCDLARSSLRREEVWLNSNPAMGGGGMAQS